MSLEGSRVGVHTLLGALSVMRVRASKERLGKDENRRLISEDLIFLMNNFTLKLSRVPPRLAKTKEAFLAQEIPRDLRALLQ